MKSISHVPDTSLIVNAVYLVLCAARSSTTPTSARSRVLEPFQRRIEEKRLLGYRCDGLLAIDTVVAQQELTDDYHMGHAPWEGWELDGIPPTPRSSRSKRSDE